MQQPNQRLVVRLPKPSQLPVDLDRQVLSQRDKLPAAKGNVPERLEILGDLLPLTLSALSRTPSSVPYSCRSVEAVLGPTPGTPGTLSTASPTSDWKSIT